MVLRYIVGSDTNRKKQNSIQLQANALLGSVVSAVDLSYNDNDYDELLLILQKYPSDVICSCHDHMGNTVLHMLFSCRAHRNNVENEMLNLVDNYRSTSKVNRRTLRRRLASNDGNSQKATLLQVVHYLAQCAHIDGTNDEVVVESDAHCVSSNITSSTSLVQQKSAGGSLPLHMACRSRYTSDQQQIDIVQYLIDAYPYGAQCPDMWGNLPLHEACDVNTFNILPPIEIIIMLIQMYPESIRIRNTDGNLPLHLVASTIKKSLSILTNMDGTPNPVNNDETEKIVEDSHELSNGSFGRNVPSYELRQLEIVEYMVGYWPESIHITNNVQQSALHQALAADANISMIEFLQWTAKKVDPPSSPLQPISVPAVPNISDVEDNDDINSNIRKMKTINPFDDDCETLNTTMNLSMLSDELVSDVQFPSNIIEMNVNGNDNESESDFDGVVELAEDYFEVVVVHHIIDHDGNTDDQISRNRNEVYAPLEGQGGLVFNNISWAS